MLLDNKSVLVMNMASDNQILTSAYTKNYKLNLLTSHSFHKELLMNHNFATLDSILFHKNYFLSRSIGTPPLDPNEGDCYLIPDKNEGAWQGQEDKISIFINNKWNFFAPPRGHTAWLHDERKFIIFLPEGWYELPWSSNLAKL